MGQSRSKQIDELEASMSPVERQNASEYLSNHAALCISNHAVTPVGIQSINTFNYNLYLKLYLLNTATTNKIR